jgi:hypothetical protein
MRIPVIQGVIDRRILVNFRVRPQVLGAILPHPFRPKLIRGWGMAGICLIRLKNIRPRHMPEMFGISSENAAHRIAVQWDDAASGQPREGVYIVRRDSNSLFNAAAGGKIFPGIHHHARFDVKEDERSFHIGLTSDDGQVRLLVDAALSARLGETSIFQSLSEASGFFEAGSVGYSPASQQGVYDGLELRSATWKVEPLDVRRVSSSFFSNPAQFPPGSAEFDCALLMRNIDHEWHDCGQMCTSVNEPT